MSYIDGFVTPVPRQKRDAYKAHAESMLPMLQEHGMRRLVEAWGDDLAEGKVTDFFRAVQAEEGETVVFSWMEWDSKEARDAGWAAVMADPRMAEPPADMPFDGKRMVWGGFEPLVDSKGDL